MFELPPTVVPSVKEIAQGSDDILNTHLTYDSLIERIHEWAMTRDDIRLAVVIGSRARTDRPADSLSDLDLLLFTTDPDRYLSESAWLETLGVYHLTFLESTAVGEFVERRVLFDGGLDVDFIPLPTHVIRGDLLPEMSAVLQRGYRVLVDKDGFSPKLQFASESTKESGSLEPQPPCNESFLHLANDFLYHAVWSAKKLCRGELWTAKMCCDGLMKRQLLQVIEWHQRATATGSVDTWHEGRFLDAWADESVLKQLHHTFAIYETDSVWSALNASVRLFGRLCGDVGKQLGYCYPSEGHDYAIGLLKKYQSMRPDATAVTLVSSQPMERTGLLHHVEINVSNLNKSSEFWGWLLEYLGYEPYQNWAEGRSWRKGETYLVLVQTEESHLEAGYHRKRTGLNHVAFHVASRAQVDELTRLLRDKGLSILYGDRHPHAGGSGHYAVFFEDPDRIKVEIVAP